MESTTTTNLTAEARLETDEENAEGSKANLSTPSPRKTSGAPRSFRLRSIAILLFVWVAAGTYTGKNLLRVWIPHDDGALAQSAQRVSQGQLPHRDFIEIYTGGLSYVYAFAFRVFGASFAAPRLVLFLVFLLWIPAVYFIATDIVPDWVAGGVTLLAAVWSVTLYPAPMPSWYNLFFATFGIAALFCYVKKRSSWWLFAAGVCGGLSFLAKSVGLYYVAGVVLFLVYLEQNETRKKAFDGRGSKSFGYSAFLGLSLLAFLTVIARLLRLQLGMPEVTHFLVPGAAIAALLLAREKMAEGPSLKNFHGSNVSSAERFATLFGLATPFLAGVLLPIALFLVPYYRAGALNDFFTGVFVLPVKRILAAYMHPPKTKMMLPAVALAGVVCLSFRIRERARTLIAGLLGLLWALTVINSFRSDASYTTLWQMVREMIPVVTVLGAIALYYLRNKGEDCTDEPQARTMILLTITATCSLIQFPFGGPIYFCYVAPLLFLTATSVLAHFERPPKLLLAGAGITAFLFAILVMRTGGVWALGNYYSSDYQTATMNLPRAGGLKTTPELADRYDEMIPLLQKFSGGHPILAGPDSPEVFFLGDFVNPTPSLFEMFEEEAGYKERLEKIVEEKSVKAVLVNNYPGFSEHHVEALRAVARERFPYFKQFGPVEVRWRP